MYPGDRCFPLTSSPFRLHRGGISHVSFPVTGSYESSSRAWCAVTPSRRAFIPSPPSPWPPKAKASSPRTLGDVLFDTGRAELNPGALKGRDNPRLRFTLPLQRAGHAFQAPQGRDGNSGPARQFFLAPAQQLSGRFDHLYRHLYFSYCQSSPPLYITYKLAPQAPMRSTRSNRWHYKR